MRIQEAKAIPLTHLLHQLRFEALYSRKNGNEWWYLSPFRKETKPSFKITVDKNTWYDFGSGEGGNILDFVMAQENTDVSGALHYLDDLFPSFRGISVDLPLNNYIPPAKSGSADRVVQKFMPLRNYALLHYLEERGIDTAKVIAYSKSTFNAGTPTLGELHYTTGHKPYYAVAIPNQSTGYELRCKGFKGCIGSKDISFFPSSVSSCVYVFEGFIDWLSLITLSDRPLEGSVIILNSAHLVVRAIELIKAKGFTDIQTYLDNDESGEKAFLQIRSNFSAYVTDNRNIYSNYDDLNAKLMASRTAE